MNVFQKSKYWRIYIKQHTDAKQSIHLFILKPHVKAGPFVLVLLRVQISSETFTFYYKESVPSVYYYAYCHKPAINYLQIQFKYVCRSRECNVYIFQMHAGVDSQCMACCHGGRYGYKITRCNSV